MGGAWAEKLASRCCTLSKRESKDWPFVPAPVRVLVLMPAVPRWSAPVESSHSPRNVLSSKLIRRRRLWTLWNAVSNDNGPDPMGCGTGGRSDAVRVRAAARMGELLRFGALPDLGELLKSKKQAGGEARPAGREQAHRGAHALDPVLPAGRRDGDRPRRAAGGHADPRADPHEIRGGPEEPEARGGLRGPDPGHERPQ